MPKKKATKFLLKSKTYNNSYCHRNNYGVYGSYASEGIWDKVPDYVDRTSIQVISNTEPEFYVILANERKQLEADKIAAQQKEFNCQERLNKINKVIGGGNSN